MQDKSVIDVVDDIAYRDFLYAYVKYLENSINPKEYVPREEVIKAHVVKDVRLAKNIQSNCKLYMPDER